MHFTNIKVLMGYITYARIDWIKKKVFWSPGTIVLQRRSPQKRRNNSLQIYCLKLTLIAKDFSETRFFPSYLTAVDVLCILATLQKARNQLQLMSVTFCHESPIREPASRSWRCRLQLFPFTTAVQ